MAEYIEREAFVKYIRSREGNFIDDMGKGWSNGMDAAASMCEKFPAADVAPVVHGGWVNVGHALIDTTGNCNKCGKQAVWRTKNKPYVICPNCGAKMDGGKENV